MVQEHSAPNKTVTKNFQVLTRNRLTNINRQYYIATGLMVPHHQHQNYCEVQGGNYKCILQKLFINIPHAPNVYCCYAVMFLDKVWRYMSKSYFDGRCGSEMIYGDTGNISIFRFYWFEPTWYYDPLFSLPKDKMIPGFFLDIAENKGDRLSYSILHVHNFKKSTSRGNPTSLMWSIVKCRDISSSEVTKYNQAKL